MCELMWVWILKWPFLFKVEVFAVQSLKRMTLASGSLQTRAKQMEEELTKTFPVPCIYLFLFAKSKICAFQAPSTNQNDWLPDIFLEKKLCPKPQLSGIMVGLVLLALHTPVKLMLKQWVSLHPGCFLPYFCLSFSVIWFWAFSMCFSFKYPKSFSCDAGHPNPFPSLLSFMLFMTVQHGEYIMSCTGNIFMWYWCQFRLISNHSTERSHDYCCHWLSHLNPLQQNVSSCTKKSGCILLWAN